MILVSMLQVCDINVNLNSPLTGQQFEGIRMSDVTEKY